MTIGDVIGEAWTGVANRTPEAAERGAVIGCSQGKPNTRHERILSK